MFAFVPRHSRALPGFIFCSLALPAKPCSKAFDTPNTSALACTCWEQQWMWRLSYQAFAVIMAWVWRHHCSKHTLLMSQWRKHCTSHWCIFCFHFCFEFPFPFLVCISFPFPGFTYAHSAAIGRFGDIMSSPRPLWKWIQYYLLVY